MQSISDETKADLKERFGTPPTRDDPLEVEKYNFVTFTAIGGPIYAIERGRVFDVVGSVEEARRQHGGVAGHDGALAGEFDDGRYVNVRTGPATMQYSWVPIEAVLEVVSPGCEWVGGEGYQPRDVRRGPLGNDMDAR